MTITCTSPLGKTEFLDPCDRSGQETIGSRNGVQKQPFISGIKC